MSAVDEILATGQYTDRRGRGWDYVETVASWCSPEIDAEGVSWGCHYLDPTQMRLLIERDMHRGVCPGFWECADHPVPRVAAIGSDYGSFAPNTRIYDQHTTLPEAMDAARALAVAA